MVRHRMVWGALAGGAIACGAAMACGNSGPAPWGGTGSPGGSSGGGNAGGGNPAAGGGGGNASGSSAPTDNGTGPGPGSGTATGGSGGTAAGGGSGSATHPIDDGGAPPPTPRMGNTCLKAGSGDYSKPGPYQVMKKASVDLASNLPAGTATPTTYTIFYPQPFETNCPHPVVAWGNGTGVTGSDVYAFYNNNAASYGIVVIASDNSNVGSGQYHKAGIDYMVKQNADSSSMFYQKLSTRVGVGGHSQGAIGATAATNLIGANCQAEVCVAGGGSPLKTTAFLCLTGTADQLESSCKTTVQIAGPPSFLADWDGGDHFTTETLAGYVAGNQGSIQMMKLYAAWFRCFLADDQVACKMFEGGTPSNCGMCKDPGWATLTSKGL
jgi:hypothetical protein